MDDHPANDKLFALYDGELAGAGRREVETHLASCAECRHVYTRWQQTARAFFRPPRVQPSEAFVRQVMERLATLGRPRRAVRWIAALRWLVPAVGLAGLLLLFIGPAQRAVSVEALLLEEERGNDQTQMMLASEPPTTDQVVGFLTEGQP